MSPNYIPAHTRIFPYTHSLTLIPPPTYMLYSEHTHPHLHLLITKCSLMYTHTNSYLLAPTYFLNTLSPTPTPGHTLLYTHSPTLTHAYTCMLFHSHRLIPTCSHIHTQPHSQQLMPTHSLMYTLIHTHTCSYPHTSL